jgi:hypothetical protein
MSSTIREMVASTERDDFAGRGGGGVDLLASVAVAIHLTEWVVHELWRMETSVSEVFPG